MNVFLAVREERQLPQEAALTFGLEWVRLGIETVAAVLVAIGVIVAVVQLCRCFASRQQAAFTGIRLTLARYLALAIEFQLAADILSTTIAPSWQQIGKLAAIAVIRTGLNFFLMRELQREEEITRAERRTT